MITHEINKPRPPSFFEQARRSVERIMDRRAIQSSEQFMPKIEFAQWVEEIKKEWPRDTLCTLASLAYVPGREPVPVFKVMEIMEIHWNAPIGEVHKQPRCVHVVSERYASSHITYEPKMLRKLTDEEIAHVDARNKATQRSVEGRSFDESGSANETFCG